MISDVLSDAVAAMDGYLTHPGTADCYAGEVGDRIRALMARMDAIRIELDAPPDFDFGSGAVKPCGCYAWAVCAHVDRDGNPREEVSA